MKLKIPADWVHDGRSCGPFALATYTGTRNLRTGGSVSPNAHPIAYVSVRLPGGATTEYTVHVARLQTAVNAAFRKFPNASAVEATREVPAWYGSAIPSPAKS